MTGGALAASTGHTTITGTTSIQGTSPALGATFNANTSTLRFLGLVNVGGADGTLGTFHANAATTSFEAATNMVTPDSLVLEGPATTSFDAQAGAHLTFGTGAAAGTNAIDLASGTLDLSLVTGGVTITAANVTIGSGTSFKAAAVATTFPAVVTAAGTVTGNTATMTFSGAVTINSGGVFNGSSGARTFNGLLTINSGGSYTSSTGAHSFTAGVTTAGTFDISTAASTPSFTNTGLTVSGGTTTFGAYAATLVTLPTLTVSGGTFDVATNATKLTVTGASGLSGGTANFASTNIVTLSGAVTVSGMAAVTLGKSAACAVTDALGNTLAVSGGSFTLGSCAATVALGATVSGGTVTLGSGATTLSSTLGVSGGAFTAGSGALTVTGATTVNAGSTFDCGTSSNVTLAALTLGNATPTTGTFNVSSATVTVGGLFSLTNSSTFNGGTGTTSFSVAEPATALVSGTFTVGTAGTTHKVTLTGDTTFGAGVSLVFPASSGELSLSQGKTLTVAGAITAATTGATMPKIDCTGCSATQGVGITLSGVMNLNGLEFDNATTAGVTVASTATYTLFKNLSFKNNAGNSASGTHLAMTLGTALVNAPGCSFDATATTNVSLHGTSGMLRGARAAFELQSTAVNGSGAGEAHDDDGDDGVAPDVTKDDNYGGDIAAPYYGSVIEWVNADPTDTAGSAVGFPVAAFDWQTFQFFGIYVAYKDTSGAGTSDVLWLRNNDGSAHYSYSVAQSSGDIVGTPFFDTINELTAGVDANGDGDQADNDVRVVYIGTSTGHIIKLVDDTTQLVHPSGGPWATDFTSATVATISSPLVEDGTNLYFGGTDGSAVTKVFGVQVAGGANEKTLQKNVGSVSVVTTTPTWAISGGLTYVFLGSTATSNQAYVYRIDMSNGIIDASFSGVTDSVNDAVTLSGGRAFAVTDGGKLHVLDALNFGVGGFTNVTGFPYQTTAAKAIKFVPWVEPATGYAYFGDDGGNLYVVTSAGANLTGYPLSISSSIKITSSPLYRRNSGVIAVGADDGYLYFVDRNNGSGPSVFKRFFVTSAGSISSVSYDSAVSAYLVSSSDGKLTFVNAADVTDPTPGTQ
jgi:hypothetical protein